MKFRFEDFYGSGRLVTEDKSYIQIPQNWILVKIGSKTGRLYSITDKYSHNGGHGMGQMYCCQGVVSFTDISLGIIKSQWNGPCEIAALEEVALKSDNF